MGKYPVLLQAVTLSSPLPSKGISVKSGVCNKSAWANIKSCYKPSHCLHLCHLPPPQWSTGRCTAEQSPPSTSLYFLTMTIQTKRMTMEANRRISSDEADKGDNKDEDGGGSCASHEKHWENFLIDLLKLRTQSQNLIFGDK